MPTITGTPRQARALVTTYNAARKRLGKFPLTLTEEAEVTAWCLSATLPDIRAKFELLNAVTGFDRLTSEATTEQRRRISQLEVGLYGRRVTNFTRQMTFQEASDFIETLATTRNEERAVAAEAASFLAGQPSTAEAPTL
jgi:hypothetical protein